MKIIRYKYRIMYFMVCIFISAIVSFVACNGDYIQNTLHNYSNKTFTSFESFHWNRLGESLVSESDPQIILSDLDMYVNNVELNLSLLNNSSDTMIIYYQEISDSEFTADKSMVLPLNKEPSTQKISIKKEVKSLRFDLTEDAGVELQLNSIEINSKKIHFTSAGIIMGLLVLAFGTMVFSFRNFIREIWDSRDVLKTLIINDLKSRYAGSFLGIVWAFVQPILTIAVFWYVFELGFKNPPVDNIQYILWFIPAYIPWMYFSDVAVNAVACIREYSYLVKKMKFKVSILPIIKVCSSFLIHFCFIIFMQIVFLCYHRKPLVMQLQLIYYCFALCIFLIGLSWLISAISVFVKDFAQIINVVLQLGFFMIPVFWNPNAMSPSVLKVLQLNPLYYIVQGYRESMIDGISFFSHPNLTIYFWTLSLLIFIVGAKLFNKVRVHFADLL